MESGKEAITKAGEQIADTYQEPQSFEEIVDYALEHPEQANFSPSDEYVLAAIESCGYRPVVEEGEEMMRPVFFDDPYNDGEHAVLGNTSVLIDFVEDLRDSVKDRGNSDSMYWFEGPTASGKSELKRCLINGLREFSKTEEGKRYTVAWNEENIAEEVHNPDPAEVGKTFNNPDQNLGTNTGGDDFWQESPDQSDPLNVFPDTTAAEQSRSIRQQVYDAMNEQRRVSALQSVLAEEGVSVPEDVFDQDYDAAKEAVLEEYATDLDADTLEHRVDQEHVPIKDRRGLDPFSQAMYDDLFEQYREELGYTDEEIGREERQKIFEKIVDEDNLMVKDYIVDVGQGIGVLNAEDNEAGVPFKQKMLGSWESQLLKKYNTGGRKDIRGFSLDGLLPKGSIMTIFEDGYAHKDWLKEMHSLPDEHKMEIRGGPDYETYPQIVVISNRDLRDHLTMEDDQYPESDPNESLLRRMERYPLLYLTEYGLSTQLIKGEVAGEDIDLLENHEERAGKIREPVFDDGMEYAPHVMEAAAVYSVLTRIEEDDTPGKSELGEKRYSEFPEGPDGEELSVLEKIELFEQGEITRDGTILEKEDFDFEDGKREGKDGVPVTYVAEVLASLSKEDTGRSDPEYLDVGIDTVITPDDAIDALMDKDQMVDAPMFDEDGEIDTYTSDSYRAIMDEFIYDRLKEDVLDAAIGNLMPDDDEIEKYVTNVIRDQDDQYNPDDREDLIDDDDDRDLFLKTFETKFLGFDDNNDYRGTRPKSTVKDFRSDDIKQVHTNISNEKRGTAESVNWQDIDVLQQRLDKLDWDHITNFHEFEGFNPHKQKWVEAGQYFDRDELDDSATEEEKVRAKMHERMVHDMDYTPASAFLTTKWTVEQAKNRGDI